MLTILIACVFVVSVSIVLYYGNYFLLGDLHNPNNDDVKYIRSAQVLLNEGTLVYNSGNEPSAFIMPGFPIILAGFMAIFGQDGGGVIAFRIFQCMLQAGSLYLVYIIARYAFNSRIAMIACFLSALYIPDYFSSGVILSETIFRTLILLLVCMMISAVQTKRWTWYVWIGVLTAAAAYFKPHASLYPAILLILWWKERYSWKDILRYTCLIGVVYLILLSPWWIRNMVTFDRFILFTNSGGSPFLLGTRINYELPPAGFFDAYPQYDPETVFKGSDADAVAKGLDILKYGFTHEPLTYLYWYTVGKLEGLYLNAYYWKPIWPITKELMYVIQAILMGLAVLGLILFKRAGKLGNQLPILLTIAYFTAIYIPFVAFSRYGYPNVVFLLMYASVAIDWAASLMKRTTRHKTSSANSPVTVNGETF